ncbi:MAG: DEAD/DEAH box helicase [Xanthomonadales bacterium]|jgi:superfamily II DNA or RNA helicase|nr:DEAD/DEAH box helicase [Xanthomonadales bacterium]
MLKLTAAAIRRAYGEAEWRRGESYAEAGKVGPIRRQALEDGSELLSAEIRGGRRTPYQAEALHFPDGRLESSCSCPVSRQCKHAAAMLWQALGPSGPAPAFSQVLATLREAAAATPATTTEEARPPTPTPRKGDQLVLLADLDPRDQQTLLLRPMLGARDEGSLRLKRELSPWRLLKEELAALTAEELLALGSLKGLSPVLHRGKHWYRAAPSMAASLHDSLAAGRLYWLAEQALPLKLGPARRLLAGWRIDAGGDQHLELGLGAEHVQLVDAGEPAWLDLKTQQLGPVHSDFDAAELKALAGLAPLAPDALASLWPSLAARYGNRLPAPMRLPLIDAGVVDAQPTLTLSTVADRDAAINRRLRRRLGHGRLGFKVGEAWLGAADLERGLRSRVGEHVERRRIDPEVVAAAEGELYAQGLSPAEDLGDPPDASIWLINPDGDEATLQHFCSVAVPLLRARGWRVDYAPGFPVQLIELAPSWFAELIPAGSRNTTTGRDDDREPGSGIDWFDLKLGIEIDGERLDLLPAVAAAWQRGELALMSSHAEAMHPLSLADGRRIPVPVGRLRQLLDTLAELKDWAGGTLRLPRFRAGALAELGLGREDSDLDWRGATSWLSTVRELSQRTVSGPAPCDPAPGFGATLRPYQREGLGWLQWLAGHGFGGCLADDMGLGKTVQVLAHLHRQHAEGQLTRPALIVAPTSVLPNWRAELARFTPNLRVLEWTGSRRAGLLGQLAEVEVVLISYPLLGRDIETLSTRRWSAVVCDESQLIRNPATLAARALRRLDTGQRLCLTGTPLENHLGELWAQFDFLLPGLLGTRAQFNRLWRAPVERRRDRDATARLRRLLKPFLLRRTKDQVVRDLPPKSLILRSIELEGRQRELYEALRVHLTRELGAIVGERGADRARIQVLDALLKLRQICCDPRLLPAPLGQGIEASAKLARLLVMLESLISEGRRVLVFSQFTSMLALIEQALQARKIRYALLTGQTEDREAPVRRFQAGEVPVFLLSLKAGGYGLNLTAADTVIHYDPWWNPAAEAQATDRAYRIGQNKPVFVYRLIAAGTVEEKIQDLQAHKQELADAILDDSGLAAPTGFETGELLALLST